MEAKKVAIQAATTDIEMEEEAQREGTEQLSSDLPFKDIATKVDRNEQTFLTPH